jgi:SAM-dependent methyltransferase
VSKGTVDFDEYASTYDAALGRGLGVSGESKEHFARERVAWLARRLRERGIRPHSVLDFGCGTGSAIPFLREVLGAEEILGIDDSVASLEVAERSRAPGVRFMLREEFQPKESFDLVFCNGVFHHVPPTERPAAVETIRRALRPGGVFALWDNNPWSPGARYVMSRIAFDRDAVPISSRESRSLLEGGGLTVLNTDFLFVFPRALRWLRRFEPGLVSLPIGAQYQVLSRRS